MIKREIVDDLVAKGILAPSADNSQPWKFTFKDEALWVDLDKERVKGFASTGLAMPYASAGSVLENIRIAALYFGYQAKFTYFPETGNPHRVARVEFKETSPVLHPHYSPMHERMTNRRFYE